MEFDTSKLRICRECEKVLRDRPFSRPFFIAYSYDGEYKVICQTCHVEADRSDSLCGAIDNWNKMANSPMKFCRTIEYLKWSFTPIRRRCWKKDTRITKNMRGVTCISRRGMLEPYIPTDEDRNAEDWVLYFRE